MTLSMLSAESYGADELVVVNPRHLEIPEGKARILLGTACQVVAEEFHGSDPAEITLQLVLVLGQNEEHYVVDENKASYTLYMREWNEAKFATMAMRVCVQRAATSRREARMVKEILRRTEKISVVSYQRTSWG